MTDPRRSTDRQRAGRNVTILTASPRAGGNSTALARACAQGAREAGERVTMINLNEWVGGGFLRDCRVCRDDRGRCTIDDRYSTLITDVVAPADAIVFASPLYFYAVAGVLKNFLDRLVCYLGASHSTDLSEALARQRTALLITSEESYPGLLTGVAAQFHEMSRYLGQDLVAIVHGVGNHRGEVARDPDDPIETARRLGHELFTRHTSDYTAATVRSHHVWG
ncbi:flavodoxin family protein [Microlunatus soli]|uniref:Multimeric flavodoxin WrbA n=1 Tax=Microlunatus soli TaxID=630515 RepID=A0A1H1QRN8_9ACTN|nr:flavodoxin family protein [Microlunatus soli]SDS26130.1 Multimeric flavodoxin WrbA [Microlunatus soli]